MISQNSEPPSINYSSMMHIAGDFIAVGVEEKSEKNNPKNKIIIINKNEPNKILHEFESTLHQVELIGLSPTSFVYIDNLNSLFQVFKKEEEKKEVKLGEAKNSCFTCTLEIKLDATKTVFPTRGNLIIESEEKEKSKRILFLRHTFDKFEMEKHFFKTHLNKFIVAVDMDKKGHTSYLLHESKTESNDHSLIPVLLPCREPNRFEVSDENSRVTEYDLEKKDGSGLLFQSTTGFISIDSTCSSLIKRVFSPDKKYKADALQHSSLMNPYRIQIYKEDKEKKEFQHHDMLSASSDFQFLSNHVFSYLRENTHFIAVMLLNLQTCLERVDQIYPRTTILSFTQDGGLLRLDTEEQKHLDVVLTPIVLKDSDHSPTPPTALMRSQLPATVQIAMRRVAEAAYEKGNSKQASVIHQLAAFIAGKKEGDTYQHGISQLTHFYPEIKIESDKELVELFKDIEEEDQKKDKKEEKKIFTHDPSCKLVFLTNRLILKKDHIFDSYTNTLYKTTNFNLDNRYIENSPTSFVEMSQDKMTFYELNEGTNEIIKRFSINYPSREWAGYRRSCDTSDGVIVGSSGERLFTFIFREGVGNSPGTKRTICQINLNKGMELKPTVFYTKNPWSFRIQGLGLGIFPDQLAYWEASYDYDYEKIYQSIYFGHPTTTGPFSLNRQPLEKSIRNTIHWPDGAFWGIIFRDHSNGQRTMEIYKTDRGRPSGEPIIHSTQLLADSPNPFLVLPNGVLAYIDETGQIIMSFNPYTGDRPSVMVQKNGARSYWRFLSNGNLVAFENDKTHEISIAPLAPIEEYRKRYVQYIHDYCSNREEKAPVKFFSDISNLMLAYLNPKEFPLPSSPYGGFFSPWSSRSSSATTQPQEKIERKNR